MQKNEVKAFRQRLVRAGFFDISIFERSDGSYSVYCSRYVDGSIVNYREVMSLERMICIPRVVWFDNCTSVHE